jgi:hypothetical protein
VASQARRLITGTEFRRVIQILKEDGISLFWKYGIPALMCFQFHMISRIDDSTQGILEHLKPHDNFPFLLKTKLNWSKNVLEERNAPWQTVLPSMDPTYCVYINLALWLELNFENNPNAAASPYIFSFSDDIRVPEGGDKSKSSVQAIYSSDVFNRIEFQATGPLGSHSTRKYGSSHCRKNRATKDEKDIRGRWKTRGHTSDVYDDIELPFPDIKVAGLLYIGGPCKYKVKGNCTGITDNFILQHVVPNISNQLGPTLAVILGTALL